MPDPSHNQNRKHWDEIAPVHYNHPEYHVKEFLDGWISLKSIEREILGDVRGKSLLHLFCQFGLDTLSWARLGAEVTGVDISGTSIELAEKLKKQSGIPGEFIESDVLELSRKLDKRFDIVFQSYGTHHWISDLTAWAEVVAHHLKPGGTFLIVDLHPIETVFLGGRSYFDRQPKKYADPDYADKDYTPKEESVEWQHTLSDIINAVIGVGLRIEAVEEYDRMPYRYAEDWVERDGYFFPPDGPPAYPLLFSLLARMKAQ